ncbi:DUF262 domain-containing protein [Brachyspira murdochii]|uniref:DUF262 domain-containing protein n=1 Tax=Brachyspira murdochii TaxID=84378 RepID=UPI003007386B
MNDKLSLIDFFKKYSRIEIPKIQRDYAQGRENESEVADRFLDKIFECLKYSTDLELDFIYGSVDKVDNVDKNVVYLLDGQQRVTTLFLLYWYIALKEDKYKEIECLKKFTYSTRVSSREFCQNIIDIDNVENIKQYYDEKSKDDDKVKLCNIIKDFYWFTNENDPTIKAMLNMIEKIEAKYKLCNENLFDKLSNIRFYFLPLEDFKLTDEIYLKMNARGKPLTSFENFKALLEDFFKGKIDEGILQQYKIKIDTSWVNFIWTLNKDCKKVDDLFMKLFRFIFEMLYYSQIEIVSKVEDIKKLEIEESSLDFFELFFSHIYDNEKKEYLNKLKENSIKNEKDQLNKNINFIINIFDIFSLLGKCKLETLFNDIFYYNNESENDEDKYNKICTFDNNLNVFNNDDNLFEFFKNIEKRILIFSVFKILNYEYLKNKENIIDNIKNTYFNKLRLIRNLLYNTNNLQNNIYYQMKLIDRIIKEDEITVIKEQLDKEKKIENILFTNDLVKSEKIKLDILKSCDEKIRKRIYACENNVFLQGNIDFLLDNIGNENIVNVVNYIFTKNGFNNENGNYLIHRAILVFIDKGEIESFKPYNSTTIYIFRNNKDNDNKKLLIKYPNKLKEFINTIFNDKVNETISDKCRNIIDNYKDDSHWKYLIIKDAKDANDNDVNLYNKEYSYSGEVKKHPYSGYYLYYQSRNSTHWDIPLSTKVHTMFSQFLKNNADFKLYYYDGTNNPNIKKGERILRYPNQNQNNDEILYCYSWVTLAKEIEIANEKVLVGFTTAGYIIQCGLRKQKSFNDPEISKKVFELLENKELNFYGYKQHYEHHDWYYMKDLSNYDEMLEEYNKILKPVIDAFLQNK